MNENEKQALLHRIAMLESRLALLEQRAARLGPYGPITTPEPPQFPFDWTKIYCTADGRNAQ